MDFIIKIFYTTTDSTVLDYLKYLNRIFGEYNGIFYDTKDQVLDIHLNIFIGKICWIPKEWFTKQPFPRLIPRLPRKYCIENGSRPILMSLQTRRICTLFAIKTITFSYFPKRGYLCSGWKLSIKWPRHRASYAIALALVVVEFQETLFLVFNIFRHWRSFS